MTTSVYNEVCFLYLMQVHILTQTTITYSTHMQENWNNTGILDTTLCWLMCLSMSGWPNAKLNPYLPNLFRNSSHIPEKLQNLLLSDFARLYYIIRIFERHPRGCIVEEPLKSDLDPEAVRLHEGVGDRVSDLSVGEGTHAHHPHPPCPLVLH